MLKSTRRLFAVDYSEGVGLLGGGRRLVLALLAIVAVGGIGISQAQAEVFTDLSLPTISGTAQEGQTLTETHARWSMPPASYAYQWQRCNSAGNDCNSVEKARSQTYRLTAADVGFTIRVGENASDAAGATTPSLSEPTAVVQALATGEHGGGRGTPNGGNGPPPACCEKSTHVSAAAIRTLLTRQLAPSGKSVSISALLKRGGLRMGFKFPEAVTLVVTWYLAPPRGKLKLVAVGHAKLAATQKVDVSVKLTSQGKALLRHAGNLDFEAVGVFTVKGEAPVKATKKFALKR